MKKRTRKVRAVIDFILKIFEQKEACYFGIVFKDIMVSNSDNCGVVDFVFRGHSCRFIMDFNTRFELFNLQLCINTNSDKFFYPVIFEYANDSRERLDFSDLMGVVMVLGALKRLNPPM